MRDDALRVVGQGLPQVLFRLLLVAAEEAGDLVVPTAERAIGGAVQKRGIGLQDGLELVTNRSAVFDPLSESEGLGEGAHVGGDPEVPVWLRGVDGHRLTR